MKNNPVIDIIGSGNVATHLIEAFSGKADVNHVRARSLDGLRNDCDLYIICVPDAYIADVSKRMPKVSGITAHTSGSIPIEGIDGKHSRRGVFYPLQTFTKNIDTDITEVPFLIEGESRATTEKLKQFASLVSSKIYDADSETRKHIHVASVIGCNFVNHLWRLAADYLRQHGLEFGLIHPLMKETLRKAMMNNPADVQTGPAARKDFNVIKEHEKLLAYDSELYDIYKKITESIISKSK
ncbi:MAG: DUF2520 domain-containing protein [Candidatus Amulumruptor caecigallinarius]|nr:DUF2520 domain-containing protein [Candidatus Amulumruptor caecigallinarius]